MTGFELWISGFGSDHSTNCTTTTTLVRLDVAFSFSLCLFEDKSDSYIYLPKMTKRQSVQETTSCPYKQLRAIKFSFQEDLNQSLSCQFPKRCQMIISSFEPNSSSFSKIVPKQMGIRGLEKQTFSRLEREIHFKCKFINMQIENKNVSFQED